eukprot:PhF_6_TR10268/c0_g1_i1/m.15915
MPFASCVELDQCNVRDMLPFLIQTAPATVTHIEVQNHNLRECDMGLLARPLEASHHINVYFERLPTALINPEIYQNMVSLNPSVSYHWGKKIPEGFPTLPSFPDILLREPCTVGDLKPDCIGFLVRLTDPGIHTTGQQLCIPCRRDAAKQFCKLFADMEWDEENRFVCSSDPDVIPALSTVQLLVAYLEQVAANNDNSETTYWITAREDHFVAFMCPRLKDDKHRVDVLRCLSQLMTPASFLNIPSLRRLIFSVVLRQSKRHARFLSLIGEKVDNKEDDVEEGDDDEEDDDDDDDLDVEDFPAKRRKL